MESRGRNAYVASVNQSVDSLLIDLAGSEECVNRVTTSVSLNHSMDGEEQVALSIAAGQHLEIMGAIVVRKKGFFDAASLEVRVAGYDKSIEATFRTHEGAAIGILKDQLGIIAKELWI